MLKIFKKKNKQPKQTTFCYCSCENELIADNSLVRDIYIKYKKKCGQCEYERNVVHFHCKKCGQDSYFDFDFPVPISLPLDKYDDILEKYNEQYGKEK